MTEKGNKKRKRKVEKMKCRLLHPTLKLLQPVICTALHNSCRVAAKPALGVLLSFAGFSHIRLVYVRTCVCMCLYACVFAYLFAFSFSVSVYLAHVAGTYTYIHYGRCCCYFCIYWCCFCN